MILGMQIYTPFINTFNVKNIKNEMNRPFSPHPSMSGVGGDSEDGGGGSSCPFRQ